MRPIGLPEVGAYIKTLFMKRNRNNLPRAVFFLSANSSKRKLRHNFITSFHLESAFKIQLNETFSVLVPGLW